MTTVEEIISNWQSMSRLQFDEYMVNNRESLIREEMEQIVDASITAIMQWHEWDKTNYIDLYDHKIEGAEIWAENYYTKTYKED